MTPSLLGTKSLFFKAIFSLWFVVATNVNVSLDFLSLILHSSELYVPEPPSSFLSKSPNDTN